jgi:3-hydroxyisobutyrate dehydrogenase
MMMRVGFIGLGAMGAPMAHKLHEAGMLAGVYNRTLSKAMIFASDHEGLRVAASPADLTDCEVAITCVSADADVLEMVDALAGALPEGAVVVDCSTVSAETAQAAGQRLAARGIGFVDAPVSGGTEGAIKGTLSIMAGGDAAHLAAVMPVLEVMGGRIVHMGVVGSGQATKAANQIAVAGVDQAVSEALAFAVAHGLDLDKVIEALGGGAAGSWFLENRGPNMRDMNFPLGFKVTLHAKDLEICRKMAERFDVKLPIVEMTLLHYARLIGQGYGEEDVSSLYRLKHAVFQAASD